MLKPLSTFTGLPVSEKKIVIEAFWQMGRARRFIKAGHKEKWRALLGTPSPYSEKHPAQESVSADHEERADYLGHLIRKTARNAPFTANCLPQACAAQSMLVRRGITQGVAYIGARKGAGEDPFDLHAWLYVGKICVTGHDGPGDLKSFKPLIRYDWSMD